MLLFEKAKNALSGLTHSLGDNIEKFSSKAAYIIQHASEEIEDSFEVVEHAAEDVWEDAKHFVEDRRAQRK